MDGPVLLCDDGSGHADRAIRRAATLLRMTHAVVVRGTQQPFKPATAGSGGRVAIEAGFDLVAEVETRPGRLAKVLLEEARRRSASVIVVGSHGGPPTALARLASVPGALVDRSDVPVLVVRAGPSPPGGNEPILACYDGSSTGRQALATAARLLVGRSAIVASFIPAVDDVAVLRSTLPWAADRETQERLARMDRQEAQAPAEQAAEGVRAAADAGFVPRAAAIGGADASSEEEQHPWKRLLRAAAVAQAACIVVGHRVSANAPGGTAHGLVQHADRPVLVVPGHRENHEALATGPL